MNAKEKAPTREATQAEAAETAACSRAAISISDFTTDGASRQPGFIESRLLFGPENGQAVTDLERLTGLPGREIRRQIERERRAGALIISDNAHGYYLTDDPGEAQRFARSMIHRSREIAQTARAVEKAAGLL